MYELSETDMDKRKHIFDHTYRNLKNYPTTEICDWGT